MAKEKKQLISVLLVDDHPLLREALRNVLVKDDEFAIIGEAGDGEEAVKMALEMKPQVVVMDISMPKMDGLEATRRIKSGNSNISVLALTVHTEDEYILDILQAGAAGYLIKNVYGKEVIQAIKAVASGDMVLSPAIGKNLLKHAARYPTKPINLEAGEKLSIRELEVLKLAAQGRTNQEIADQMNINQRTVKGYLTEIFSKLRVGSRTEAVITGLRAGYISIDDLQ
jgi:NarL family two-component system response regulator LiaR